MAVSEALPRFEPPGKRATPRRANWKSDNNNTKWPVLLRDLDQDTRRRGGKEMAAAVTRACWEEDLEGGWTIGCNEQSGMAMY